MFNQELWNGCVNYHGHSCGGLAIGFRVSYYALELLADELTDDDLDNLCCTISSDKCPADAVRYLLGATQDNGRLSFDISEDSTAPLKFRFYTNDVSLQITLKEKPAHIKPEDSVVYYLMSPENSLFEIEY